MLIGFCSEVAAAIVVALLRILTPGAGFRGATLFRSVKNKKNGLRGKISGLSVQMRMGTKQNEKTRPSPTNQRSYDFILYGVTTKCCHPKRAGSPQRRHCAIAQSLVTRALDW